MDIFQKRSNEYDKLTEDEKALYDEAVNCGAGHEDAMEAAETFKIVDVIWLEIGQL